MLGYQADTLKEISQALRKRFPEEVVFIAAFGSKVRGDHDEWSDFDLLVVVKNKTPEIEREVIGIIVDEEMKKGLSLTPVVKDSAAFELEKQYHTPFYENIVEEGVVA